MILLKFSKIVKPTASLEQVLELVLNDEDKDLLREGTREFIESGYTLTGKEACELTNLERAYYYAEKQKAEAERMVSLAEILKKSFSSQESVFDDPENFKSEQEKKREYLLRVAREFNTSSN